MSNNVDKKAAKVAAKRGRKPAANKTDTARSGKKAAVNKANAAKDKNTSDSNAVIDETLYGEVISEQEAEAADANMGIHAQDPYQYFKTNSLKASMNLSLSQRKRGKEIVQSGNLKLIDITSGYTDDYEHLKVSRFTFRGVEESYGYNSKVDVMLMLSRNSVLTSKCNCYECRSSFYWAGREGCAYRSAALDLAIDYLDKNNNIDATDYTGTQVINTFAKRKRSLVISESRQQEKSLVLEPRLVCKDKNISLSFKIGEDKLFVVKDLMHFAGLVQKSETETYGSNTTINHGIQNFTQSSKKWVEFIQDCVAEEERLKKTLQEVTWKNVKKRVANLELYGWRVDRLYELVEKSGINYENRDKKKKSIIKGVVKDPKLLMTINPLMDCKEFIGISALMIFPKMYVGSGRLYYMDDDNAMLCKVTDEFYEHLGPLLSKDEFNEDGVINLQIGRANLADFYYGVLPELSEHVDIIENKPELIEQYLLPETKFSFYLDADNDDVDCRVIAQYGDKKCSCLDMFNPNAKIENYRVAAKEHEILYSLEKYFPVTNLDTDRMSCGGDEELIYEVVSEGVEELAKLGNVYCTNKFKNIGKAKTATVSVGVSVSGGMLELDLLTQDMNEDELLELLKNYKKNSKYYRFKSGEFIDLQESSLQMLFEMMESMHMSPKDFVKGKMNLPLYRTLYLDKMLEEHSDVYNTRDQQFKNIIKNMKSVAESDYEVPKSLDKIMRNYQKNGFRWMKTLEDCGFGGILADDMGLGKTLQTISVLLDAKESGREGTSIIISPASLVFNWGEEFAKFAPQLKVQMLAGKAAERTEIIEDYENVDVLITSYDILKRDIDQYADKQFLYEIIDEAQYIKNQTTAASKAVKLINSKVRFALTGTPIENRLSELWSIFDYLMPGFLYTYDSFRKDFENPIVKYGDEEQMARLQKMVRPFIMRRLKKDVLKDLPDKLEESRVVRFDGEQQKLYDAQVVHMKNELNSGDDEDFRKNKLRILAELTRLRQICCDPHLCFENYKGDSAKLDSCLELIESAISGGHKILLFSQFTSMLAIIETALSDRDIAYYKITGETSKQDRLSMVKQFNEDDTPVFLISLKAGGVGLNLTGADVVIHYDPWWNVAVQNQATDRAHRIGQTKKVTVYKMIAKGTIEEKIVKLQETKKDLADNIINGENVGIGSMSKDDIMELLGV